MFNTSQCISQAIVAVSTHAPEAFTQAQVALLERLAFECQVALQEREIAQKAKQDERELMLSQATEYERLIEARIAAESDALDHQIAHLV